MESDRSFPNEFMSYPKANIHFFLRGMYYSTRGTHCTRVKNAATPCTTEMYNTKTVCFPRAKGKDRK